MRAALVLGVALSTGCGYVGDPLPPALHIPHAVADLAVKQVGDQLLVSFTIPGTTTEDLPVKTAAIDLRIGPSQSPFDLDSWAAGVEAARYEPRPPGPVELRFPVAQWAGKDTVFAVRLQNARGRYSAWSPPVTLQVVAPVDTPRGVRAASHPKGVRLTWQPQPGAEWLVFTQAPGDQEFKPAATVNTPEFIHETQALGKPHSYRVQARRGHALSEMAPAVSITPEDKFGPATPRALTAIAGLNTIELAWERNTDADLKGYRVLRADTRGGFAPQGDLVEAPAYSDRAVEPGKTYRYQIVAVDQLGNESTPSEPVEITAP